MGVVKSFNDSRGYGFIITDGGLNYFVHYSSILAEGRKTLLVGQRVTFDVYECEKGLQAKNVTVIE